MIDFKEIPNEDDTWELFSRDFLDQLGFFIESPPDRGPDGGKDIIVTEEVSGKFHRYRFRWLVSCKHFAHSGKAVNENDHEKNILERLEAFNADGFIGFYSTLASSGLNSRLQALRKKDSIKDYKILDYQFIENLLISTGFSELMMRYFPESYKNIKPLHLIMDKYEALKCVVCGKDLLLQLFKEEYKGLIAQLEKKEETTGKYIIEDVYCACKGDCDREINQKAAKQGKITGWIDISDIIIPLEFLNRLFAMMNNIRNGHEIYTDEAYRKQKEIFIILAQKVLRNTTEKERERYKELLSLP